MKYILRINVKRVNTFSYKLGNIEDYNVENTLNN